MIIMQLFPRKERASIVRARASIFGRVLAADLFMRECRGVHVPGMECRPAPKIQERTYIGALTEGKLAAWRCDIGGGEQ